MKMDSNGSSQLKYEPFNLTFKIQDENDETAFKEYKVSGQIPLVSDTYKAPDLSAEVDYTWLKDWLESSGMNGLSEVPDEIFNRCKKSCTMGRYLLPEFSPNDPKLEVFMYYIIFFSMAGNMKELKNKAKGKTMSIKMGQMIAKVGIDIIQGKYPTIEDLPDVPEGSMPLIKGLFIASNRCREILGSEEFDSLSTYFIKGLGESLVGLTLFNSVLNEPLSLDTLKYIKRFSNGSEALVELAQMTIGHTLAETARKDLLFRKILDVSFSILSQGFELFNMENGVELRNIVLAIAREQNVGVPEAYALALKDVEKDVEEFQRLRALIKLVHKKNMRMEKYMKITENFINGYFYSQIKNQA